MPKYEPSDEEMETYSSTSRKEAAVTKPSSVDDENDMAAEILIDKDQLPKNCKVGDEYTFRVTADYGDEKSLELVGHGKGKETDTEEPMSETAQDMAALSEESE